MSQQSAGQGRQRLELVAIDTKTGPSGAELRGDLASNTVARIIAGSDHEAVGQWLAEYRRSPRTLRTYRREAERLLLWLGEQGLSLAEVRREHLDAFEAFLTDPRPRDVWVGPPRARRSPEWRPFRGPLSPASRRQALVILQGLFAWLVEAGWVAHNPFRLMRDKRRRLDNRQTSIERYLERPLWAWFWGWLSRPPAEPATPRRRFEWQRRRLVFGFAYLLAPRIAEISGTRMGDFRRREGRWWWEVVGKGSKRASIPVPPDMLALLSDWRVQLGLPPEPLPDEDEPLLRSLDGRRGLGDNRLYRLIRESFTVAAEALETQGDALGARQLRRATPHWLRHTALTHQAQAGVELRYLAATARHARLDTTARYLHAEAEEWHRQQARHGLDRDAGRGRADEPGESGKESIYRSQDKADAPGELGEQPVYRNQARADEPGESGKESIYRSQDKADAPDEEPV